MNKPVILKKQAFLKLTSDAIWSKYKALAKAYEELTYQYERSLEIKGGLRGKVADKSEVIAQFREDMASYKERQAISGSQAHNRTNLIVADALGFWRAHMASGENLSHKSFQKMHRQECPESNLSDETYRKLKTAALKAWVLYPHDLDMFITASKFFRNKPKGTFSPE